MKLRIKVEPLPDGRFRVRYYWHWWQRTCEEYCQNQEAVSKFVANLVTKTNWK